MVTINRILFYIVLAIYGESIYHRRITIVMVTSFLVFTMQNVFDLYYLLFDIIFGTESVFSNLYT